MNRKELQKLVALGEDSGREFKEDINNPDSLAAELVAFFLEQQRRSAADRGGR